MYEEYSPWLNLSGWCRLLWAGAGFLVWAALQKSLLVSFGCESSPMGISGYRLIWPLGIVPMVTWNQLLLVFQCCCFLTFKHLLTQLDCSDSVLSPSTRTGTKNSSGRSKIKRQLFNKLKYFSNFPFYCVVKIAVTCVLHFLYSHRAVTQKTFQIILSRSKLMQQMSLVFWTLKCRDNRLVRTMHLFSILFRTEDKLLLELLQNHMLKSSSVTS